MQLISWSVENFMKIQAAYIEPSGHLTVIAGPNEAGKSTAVNAIWHALGASEKQPEQADTRRCRTGRHHGQPRRWRRAEAVCYARLHGRRHAPRGDRA